MSATRLLVLGVVRSFGEAHGYQVRRELTVWQAQDWANVKPGSIYHALRQLAKAGALRSTGTHGSDQGPERTGYALTEDGETEFLRLLRRALSDPEVKPEMWGAGITFLTCLSRAEAVSLLRYRVANLQACVQSLSGAGSMVLDQKPEHVVELFRWWVAEYEAAIAFTEQMAGRIEGGAYRMADDDPEAFGAPGGSGDLTVGG